MIEHYDVFEIYDNIIYILLYNGPHKWAIKPELNHARVITFYDWCLIFFVNNKSKQFGNRYTSKGQL